MSRHYIPGGGWFVTGVLYEQMKYLDCKTVPIVGWCSDSGEYPFSMTPLCGDKYGEACPAEDYFGSTKFVVWHPDEQGVGAIRDHDDAVEALYAKRAEERRIAEALAS